MKIVICPWKILEKSLKFVLSEVVRTMFPIIRNLASFRRKFVEIPFWGNGFMITVTNIETFHDHFAHYVKVTVVAVVAVAGLVSVVGVVYVVAVVTVVCVVAVVTVVAVGRCSICSCRSWCSYCS